MISICLFCNSVLDEVVITNSIKGVNHDLIAASPKVPNIFRLSPFWIGTGSGKVWRDQRRFQLLKKAREPGTGSGTVGRPLFPRRIPQRLAALFQRFNSA